MVAKEDHTEKAIELMESALALLDAAGERDAALMLQEAISIASREPIPATREEAELLFGALDQAGSNRPANSRSR